MFIFYEKSWGCQNREEIHSEMKTSSLKRFHQKSKRKLSSYNCRLDDNFLSTQLDSYCLWDTSLKWKTFEERLNDDSMANIKYVIIIIFCREQIHSDVSLKKVVNADGKLEKLHPSSWLTGYFERYGCQHCQNKKFDNTACVFYKETNKYISIGHSIIRLIGEKDLIYRIFYNVNWYIEHNACKSKIECIRTLRCAAISRK